MRHFCPRYRSLQPLGMMGVGGLVGGREIQERTFEGLAQGASRSLVAFVFPVIVNAVEIDVPKVCMSLLCSHSCFQSL